MLSALNMRTQSFMTYVECACKFHVAILNGRLRAGRKCRRQGSYVETGVKMSASGLLCGEWCEL